MTAYSYSQLTTITVIDRNATDSKIEDVLYDSLSNIGYLEKSKEYLKFIGQKILFYPRSENSDISIKYYGNFYVKPTPPDTIWLKRRKIPKPKDYTLRFPLSDKYKPTMINQQRVCQGNIYDIEKLKTGYYTPANEIEGKLFTIIDIKVQNKFTGSNTMYDLYISLVSDKNDTLIWKMENLYNKSYAFPVVIEGYYEKIKKLYVGKSFYNKNSSNKMSGLDINSGKINMPIVGRFNCIDLCLIGEKNKFQAPCLVFEDSLKNKYAVNLTDIPDLYSYLDYGNCYCTYKYPGNFNSALIVESTIYEKEKEDAARIANEKRIAEEKQTIEDERLALKELQQRRQGLLKKYGKKYTELILKGYVETGMNKQMCIESWGKPDDVNKTSGSFGVHEQWVYGNSSYLYFENGILTTIQN